MHTFPIITTPRLLLRQFHLRDAPIVQYLAGHEAVAAGTFMPHPYADGMAEQWIASLQPAYEAGEQINFAIVLAAEDILIGSVGLVLNPSHRHGQMGYWIGVPYWKQGYATEAARAVLRFGFVELDLHRMFAPHFGSNPTSGRVLQKIGLIYEGRQREHYLHQGQFRDAELYGLLQEEYIGRYPHTP